MGANGGCDVLVEHDHSSCVGKIHASWEGKDGSLRVAGSITDAEAINRVKRGDLRGLSLGTGVIQTMDGEALLRTQEEISLCDTPRRGGCYIDTINGTTVRTVTCASQQGTRHHLTTLTRRR